MKVLKKLKVFILSLVICFGMLALPVQAATETQDGLDVSFTTDKDLYSEDESITANLKVKNTNDYTVDGLELEVEVPEGYQVEKGKDNTLFTESLDASEGVSLSVTLVKKESEKKNDGTGKSTGDGKTDKTENQQGTGNTNTSGTGKTSGNSKASGNGKTSGNSNASGSTRTSNNAKTGDSNQVVIWVVILVIAAAVIILLVKRKGKKLFSVFLGMIMLVSLLQTDIKTVDAKEAEHGSSTISVSKTVKVKDVDLKIKGNVTYEKIKQSSDDENISLKNFDVDETNFLCGYESEATFTVEAGKAAKSVKLCTDDGTIGNMHDDGLDGDVKADDGIYTYIMLTSISEVSTVDYYAKSGDAVSNRISLYYFEQPTEKTKKFIEDVQKKMADIESDYEDEDGYVPNDKVSKVISKVADYIEDLDEDGKVIYYEVNDDNIAIQFYNGLQMVYMPKVKDIASIGSDIEMTVITYQPFYESLETSLIDNAANVIASQFSNYNNGENYQDSEVTLDSIKSLSSNQIILWTGHGNYNSSSHSYLLLDEWFSIDEVNSDPDYYLDYLQGRVIMVNGGRLCITGKYISKYCKNLNNDLIYLGACKTGMDSTLADAFLNNGATAVVANTNTIFEGYDSEMIYSTMDYMTKVNSETNNYYSLNEALSAAKRDNGENDIDWAKANEIKEEDAGKSFDIVATPMIFGGTDAENYRFADITHPELLEYSKLLSKSANQGKMAVFDLNNDGIYEVAIRDASANDSLPSGEGILTYNESTGLISNSFDIDYVAYIDESTGRFMTDRERGKAIHSFNQLGSDGTITTIGEYCVPYLADLLYGATEEDVATYNEMIQGMEAPNWVYINDDNIKEYLTGDGKSTGTTGETPETISIQTPEDNNTYSEEDIAWCREQLCIPEDANITYEVGNTWLWEGSVYPPINLVRIDFYENGEWVAGADFNTETLEATREMSRYPLD